MLTTNYDEPAGVPDARARPADHSDATKEGFLSSVQKFMRGLASSVLSTKTVHMFLICIKKYKYEFRLALFGLATLVLTPPRARPWPRFVSASSFSSRLRSRRPNLLMSDVVDVRKENSSFHRN